MRLSVCGVQRPFLSRVSERAHYAIVRAIPAASNQKDERSSFAESRLHRSVECTRANASLRPQEREISVLKLQASFSIRSCLISPGSAGVLACQACGDGLFPRNQPSSEAQQARTPALPGLPREHFISEAQQARTPALPGLPREHFISEARQARTPALPGLPREHFISEARQARTPALPGLPRRLLVNEEMLLW